MRSREVERMQAQMQASDRRYFTRLDVLNRQLYKWKVWCIAGWTCALCILVYLAVRY